MDEVLFGHARTAVTTHPQHATEVAGKLPLDDYDGIVSIGGDGILHEIIQGLMTRRDWRHAIGRLSLGVLPGGSGNGFVRGLIHAAGELYNIQSAAFMLLKNISTPIRFDLSSVMTETDASLERRLAAGGAWDAIVPPQFDQGKRIYSIHQAEWGLVADIDFESERWRWCGAARFTCGGIVRALGVRVYSGRLSYLAPDDAASADSDVSRCISAEVSGPRQADLESEGGAVVSEATADTIEVEVTTTSTEQQEKGGASTLAARDLRELNCDRDAEEIAGDAEDLAPGPYTATDAPPLQYLPADKTSGTDLSCQPGWRTLEGDFSIVWALQTRWQSIDVQASPKSLPDDGLIYLIVGRRLSEVGTVRSLLSLNAVGSVRLLSLSSLFGQVTDLSSYVNLLTVTLHVPSSR